MFGGTRLGMPVTRAQPPPMEEFGPTLVIFPIRTSRRGGTGGAAPMIPRRKVQGSRRRAHAANGYWELLGQAPQEEALCSARAFGNFFGGAHCGRSAEGREKMKSRRPHPRAVPSRAVLTSAGSKPSGGVAREPGLERADGLLPSHSVLSAVMGVVSKLNSIKFRD